jgi:hypothetical protein
VEHGGNLLGLVSDVSRPGDLVGQKMEGVAAR